MCDIVGSSGLGPSYVKIRPYLWRKRSVNNDLNCKYFFVGYYWALFTIGYLFSCMLSYG